MQFQLHRGIMQFSYPVLTIWLSTFFFKIYFVDKLVTRAREANVVFINLFSAII